MRCYICDQDDKGLTNYLPDHRVPTKFHKTEEGYVCSYCQDAVLEATSEFEEQGE